MSSKWKNRFWPIYAESRTLKESWELEYVLCVLQSGVALCLWCVMTNCDHEKLYNLKHQYETRHKIFFCKFEDKRRKKKLHSTWFYNRSMVYGGNADPWAEIQKCGGVRHQVHSKLKRLSWKKAATLNLASYPIHHISKNSCTKETNINLLPGYWWWLYLVPHSQKLSIN